ncbi:MAG: phytoene desaturase family protein [Jiangellaceae bacterium]
MALPTSADAVVVGAGPNGLVAANVLADAGWDVVVLEAEDHLGGAVSSAETTVPGFVVDLCSAFYPLAAASPVLRELDLEVEWEHAPLVLAHPLPDGRCVTLSRDVETTAASVGEFAAADAARWRALFDEWQAVRDDLLDALFRPFPPVRAGGRLARLLGPSGVARLARRAVLPVRRLADEEFDGDGARLLLAGNALHADLSPDSAGSGIYGWLLGMLAQDFGFPVPHGGAGRLADALAGRAEKSGAVLVTDAPVQEVVVRAGRALGVRTADGAVRATRAVLADVPAPILFGDLVSLDVLPAAARRMMDRYPWDDATLKVNYALSGPVPWRAEAARAAGTLHVGADLDGLTSFSSSLARGEVPAEPFLLVGQMTTADATRSPAGTESLWAYTHLPGAAADDDAVVAEQVRRVESVLERYAPGFADLVLARHVQGPADLQQHNRSLVGGAINAGTAQPFHQLVFRPWAGLGRAETPVERLFLASASAHPGGGVHGACGANAARAALLAARAVTGRAASGMLRSVIRSVNN